MNKGSKNKDKKPLFWIGGAALLWYLLGNKSKASSPATEAAAHHANCPAVGLDNPVILPPYNNPGAIISSGINWQGKKTYPYQCFHESFESPFYGWRALWLNLKTYANMGLNNIENVVYMWAKGTTGEKPVTYINFVVNYVNNSGFTVNEKTYITPGSQLWFEMGEAIVIFENGVQNTSIVQGQLNDAKNAFSAVYG